MLLAAAHAFELYDRARQQQIEQSELRKVLAESELEILKTQLHPHFLFNTLQGISSLVQEDPALAREMIGALAGLLRAALKHSSGDVVALEIEMEFLTAYLNLEKMRLGDRLQIRLGISQDARQCLVPQLILQPLVENAIVHGIAKGRNGGWIEISSELNEQQLRLRVTNSLSSPASNSGTGVGISNVRSRLKHLYEDDARLTFRRTDSTAEALLVLPALRGKPVCTPS
jgi:LytS/YehU family sensor histidine kinase